MENKELHEEFLKDLSILLKKYNATMEYEMITGNYYSDQVMVVDFNGIYEGDNQRDYSQLKMPSYID